MARSSQATTLWRYQAFGPTDVFELEPIVAPTAARALELAERALEGSHLRGVTLRSERLTALRCTTPGCLGVASTDRAGRYLCDACAEWFAPGLF